MARIRNLRKEAKYRRGPGTPAYRFQKLMDELEKRFPDPQPFSAQAGEGRLLAMLDAEREGLRTMLAAATLELNQLKAKYEDRN